jgi:hypothetical protein
MGGALTIVLQRAQRLCSTFESVERQDMDRQGDEVHVSEEEASGGVQPHIVRYVLGVSLLLIVLLMSAIWILGSITR